MAAAAPDAARAAAARVADDAYASYDAAYAQLVERVEGGCWKQARQVDPETGNPVRTRSVFADQIRVRLPTVTRRAEGIQLTGFPDLLMKHVNLTMVGMELAWFLRGGTNGIDLENQGCKIWGEWRKAAERGLPGLPPGELGPIYGEQWRGGVDQIDRIVGALFEKPFDRTHVVSAWDAARLDQMVLKPCHFAFQVVCEPGDDDSLVRLNVAVTMRSTDVALGLPFNIASYSILAVLIANVLNQAGGSRGREVTFVPHELVVTMNDCHIYEPHLDALREISAPWRGGEPPAREGRSAGNGPRRILIPDALSTPNGFAAASKADLQAMFPGRKGPRVKFALFT